MNLQILEQKAGIIFEGVNAQLLPRDLDTTLREVRGGFACDSQPSLVTVSNAGIPAWLSTYFNPKIIDVLVAPMKAAEIVGSEEIKMGDWVTETATFQMAESTGETSSYDDYSENGSSNVNINYPSRQSYHYQTTTQWGEKQLARAGLTRVDLASRMNIASILTLNKTQNAIYFYGVAGLQNYGLLNDPSLSAPVTPAPKTAGGVSWANGTAVEIYDDISMRLYSQLQIQSNGLVDLESPMTLAMSPNSQKYLTKTNDFKVNVKALLAENYPNMKIKTAPEYATESGELVQLILDEYEGQRTAQCAFTEKMRAHAVVVHKSSYEQKKSGGAWGTVIFRPMFISQMLGV